MCITGLLSILIVRLLGPSEYGKYSLVWQLISTIGPIVSLGWQATLAKFVPEKTDEEKNSLFTQSFLSVLVASIIFFIIGFFIIQLFPKIIPLEIKDLKFVFLIFITLVAFFNVFEGFYRGLGKFNEWTVIDGIRSNLSYVLAIIFFILGFRFYKTIIFSSFFFAFLFVVLIIFLLKNYFDFNVEIFSIEKEIIKFAFVMFVGQISYLFISSIDLVLLRAMLKDPTQVGIYNAGIRIPKMIETMFIGILPTPFLYYFTSQETKELKEKILEFGSRFLAVVFGFVSVVLFSFSKEIIIILFGQKYAESIPVLQILSFSLFILAFLVLFSSYFYSINKPQIVVILGILQFILIGLFSFLLIPKLKSQGPAVGYILNLLIYTFIVLLIVKNYKFFSNFVLLVLTILISYFSSKSFLIYLMPIVYLVLVFLFKIIKFSEIYKFSKIIKNEPI
jgi:O-antigen/teichoic acid export membrane protein